MNRRHLLYMISCCFTLIGFSPIAEAAADFVILGQGNAFWTNNLDAPICQQLNRLPMGCSANSIGFTPGGNWVVLSEGQGFYTSNIDLPACRKLSELNPRQETLKCAAFSPAGGWIVLWNQNGNWTDGDIPPDAFKKVREVMNSGGTLRSIAFGPHGAWVVLSGETDIACGNIPDDLGKVFDHVRKDNLIVSCVCFTPTGTWICLTNNGWWTSDVNDPASIMIANLVAQHQLVRWVAVAPEFGPHDFKKWAAVIHQHCDGKLLGGYAFEVLQHGKVVAAEAQGWARAPWETDHPSVPWTLDKPMGIASVSKTITAVSLLKLWQEMDEGFSLDGAFWPHIKDVCPEASPDVKMVTIRQLFEHKSGFKKGDTYDNLADIEKLLKQPLAFKPGAHYEYDNNNYYLARLVLEQIGRVKYTPYVKEHVLKRMGITGMETHFQTDQPTCGYGKLGSTRPGYPFDWNCETTAGAAGWYASITDLGRFLIGLRDHRVLSTATTNMMYEDLLGWDSSDPGWEKAGDLYWTRGILTGPRIAAFHSSIFHFPDDVDAVMFINSDPDKLPQDILRDAWIQSMQR
jgi:CubicO group peptidase (beta-lactamase class C family)